MKETGKGSAYGTALFLCRRLDLIKALYPGYQRIVMGVA